MKKGWEIKKLGDIVDKYNGLWKGKKPPFVKVAVIRNTNFSKDCKLRLQNIEYLDVEEKQYKTRKLFEGDIIIEKSGGSDKQPVGRPILFDIKHGEYSFSNFTSAIRVKEGLKIMPKFLQLCLYNHYLLGATFPLQSATTGIHNLDFKGYLELEVPVPSLLEQGRIVEVLDAAFAKIDALKENAQKNLENAKALFQQVLKQELTPKPNWQTKKLSEIATDFSRGKSKHRPRNDKKLFGGNYPFIQTGDIRNSQKYVKKFNETYNEFGLSQSKLWPKGTLCITIAANIAETAILDFPCCFPDSVIGLVPNNKLVDVNFIYFTLLLYKNELQNLGKGSAQDNINLGTFEKNQFPFPTKKEQEEIVMTIDAISQKCSKVIANAEKTIAECDALKQAVLRRAFNGEL